MRISLSFIFLSILDYLTWPLRSVKNMLNNNIINNSIVVRPIADRLGFTLCGKKCFLKYVKTTLKY